MSVRYVENSSVKKNIKKAIKFAINVGKNNMEEANCVYKNPDCPICPKMKKQTNAAVKKMMSDLGKKSWEARQKKAIEQSKKILSRAAQKERSLPPPVIGGAGIEKHD